HPQRRRLRGGPRLRAHRGQHRAQGRAERAASLGQRARLHLTAPGPAPAPDGGRGRRPRDSSPDSVVAAEPCAPEDSMTTTARLRPEDERLPFGSYLAFGLQHVLTMYGGIIAVPLIMGGAAGLPPSEIRSEEHTSELQSRENLVCRLLLEK